MKKKPSKKGFSKGFNKGYEIRARNLSKMGMDVRQVIQAINLSLEEVEKIKAALEH